MTGGARGITAVAIAVSGLLISAAAPIPGGQIVSAVGGSTTRTSTNAAGLGGDAPSEAPRLSGDGQFTAFVSFAQNWAPPVTLGGGDVFLKDRLSNSLTLVSVAADGAASNGFSYYPAVSDDGRYVAFQSTATNLVLGDSNSKTDVFVRDIQLQTTSRVSVDASGGQSNGFSESPRLTPDGQFVAFQSDASNLVAGDTNGKGDVFIRDLVENTISRVSLYSSGDQANGRSLMGGLSSNGRFVAFASDASNLVAGDTNASRDIFLRDRLAEATTRVSVDSTGAQAGGVSVSGDISGDARYVVFDANAPNLVANDRNAKSDIFLHDRVTGITTRLSVDTGGAEAADDSFLPSISEDGGVVAFQSRAANLVSDDTNGARDIFIRRTVAGTTERVSVDSIGDQGVGNSILSSVSGNGAFVSFDSGSSTLVAGDTNGAPDVFLRDVGPPPSASLDLPVVFIHGITANFNDVGFDAVLLEIGARTQSAAVNFEHYQDAGGGDGGPCISKPLIVPAEPNGNMPINLESAGASICDSQGDLALNVTRLHHDVQAWYFEAGRRPVVLIGNSMGAAIIRGFLAYSAELADDVATTMVDSVFFLEGAQAGTKPGRNALEGTWPDVWFIGLANLDLSRPAIQDVVSESAWYQWTNPPASHVPDLPYFNVYGDMRVTANWTLWWLGTPQTFPVWGVPVGDSLIYPGVDDPHAVPVDGGARFLPNSSLGSQQWQWGLEKNFDFTLIGEPPSGEQLPNVVGEIMSDPILHGNFGDKISEILVADCANFEATIPLDEALLNVIVGRVTENPYMCAP